MSHPVYSIAVIMERCALANRWQAQTWEAIGIVPDPGDAVTPRCLSNLFSDPQFNVMDGLDTYIDDYSKPDLIP